MSSSFAALAFFVQLWYAETARGAGPTPKGGTPMSTADIIGILMLVIAVISLGFSIGKGMKQPPPDSSKKRQFQAINLSDWPPSCSNPGGPPLLFYYSPAAAVCQAILRWTRQGGRQAKFFPGTRNFSPCFHVYIQKRWKEEEFLASFRKDAKRIQV